MEQEFRRNKTNGKWKAGKKKPDECAGLTADSAGGSGGFLVFSVSQLSRLCFNNSDQRSERVYMWGTFPWSGHVDWWLNLPL